MQHKNDCPYFGVDFSSLDSIVDENLLFSQVDFIIVRAYGRDHTGTGDADTAYNVDAAQRHGCPVGCYYFGFPIVDPAAGITTDAHIIANAEEQAQQFIDKLYSVFGNGNVGDIMPMLDLEGYVDSTSQYGHTATGSKYYPQEVMTNDQVTTWTLAFKNYFNNATGWRLGMYTGEYWIRASRPQEGAGLTHAQLQSLNPPDDPLPLWVARYDEYNTINDTVPNFGNWTEFAAWQYTGTGDAAAHGISEPKYNYLDYNRTDDVSRLYATRIATPAPADNKIYLGSTGISNIYLGNSPIQAIYLGANKFYTLPVIPVTTIAPAETVQNNIPITITLTSSDPNATIYYRIGTGAQQTYTAPFTVNQTTAGVNSTQITITYWAVGATGTEEEKTITYDTSGAIPEKSVLTATPAEGQVSLEWTPTANTLSYSVYRSTTAGFEGTPLTNAQYISATNFNDTTVAADTTYYYTVRSNNLGNFMPSDQVAATTPAAAPVETGYRYIRQWMNGGMVGASTTNYNTILEFQAISASAGNVLLGKSNLEGWAGKLAGTTNPPSTMTDGITADMWNYCIWSDSTGVGAQKITYDMGALYTDLTEIKTWHNFASTGRFYNFKIEVCATNSPNDADWVTIIDAMNNSTTKTYEETANGFSFDVINQAPPTIDEPEPPLATGTLWRYMKIQGYGSDAEANTTRLLEFEAWEGYTNLIPTATILSHDPISSSVGGGTIESIRDGDKTAASYPLWSNIVPNANIVFDFGAERNLSLLWFEGYSISGTERINRFRILVSNTNNGTDWAVLWDMKANIEVQPLVPDGYILYL